MAHGLRVIGSHGVVQIDEVWPNFGNVARGRYTFSSGWPSDGSKISGSGPGDTWGAQTPVIAFTATDYTHLTTFGSPWAWDLSPAFPPAGAAANPDIKWYVFDKVPVGASLAGVYGLIVRDAAGNITFRSDMPPMRVIGQQTYTGNVADETFTMPSADCAVIISGGLYCATGSATVNMKQLNLKMDGTTLYKKFVDVNPVNLWNTTISGQLNPSDWTATFVDITNYN